MFEHPMFNKSCCQASVHVNKTILWDLVCFGLNKLTNLSCFIPLIYTSHVKFVKGQVFRHVNPTKSEHFTFRNYFLPHRSIVNTVCFSYLILGSLVARKSSRTIANDILGGFIKIMPTAAEIALL